MQTAGNGVLGTIGSVGSTTLTMNTPPGAALVYVGQTIQVYDSTLTTNRGSCNVVAADPISSTQTITIDALPAGTIATDVIVHDGLSGAQPTSLFGIKYHQNNATTGTWLNLNRATYPQQLQTPRVNAANSALVPGYVRLAINKVRKALGIGHLGKLIAYTSVEQEHAWENLGITISQVIKENASGSANDLDLLFSGRKTMSGVPIKSSINADQTRVDFLDLSHWGRAVIKDIDYLRGGRPNRLPDLRNVGRTLRGVHLLLRHRLPGVFGFTAQRRVYRRAGETDGLLAHNAPTRLMQSPRAARKNRSASAPWATRVFSRPTTPIIWQYESYGSSMKRRRRFGGGWRLPAAETASAKRIIARCGDGRGWRG